MYWKHSNSFFYSDTSLHTDYSLIAPSAIANQKEWLQKFDVIYQKYGGSREKEELLSKKLAKKYGSTVKLLVATQMDGRSTKKKRSHVSNDASNTKITTTQIKDESWFDLNELESNSGITDFTSKHFDPFATLNENEQKLANRFDFIKNAQRLDNIAKARILLSDFDPQRVIKTIHIDHSCSKDKNHIEKNKIRKVPVLTSLASQFQTGPLSILYQCHVQRKRVRVLIRYVDCIRGTLTGYLLAFDKHMNMILTDVDEVYSQRITKVAGHQEQNDEINMSKAELELYRRKCYVDVTNDKLNQLKQQSKITSENIPSNRPNWFIRQRNCAQLLVRGDNVVMVWKPDAESSNDHYNIKHSKRSHTMNSANMIQVGTPGSLKSIYAQYVNTSKHFRRKRTERY